MATGSSTQTAPSIAELMGQLEELNKNNAAAYTKSMSAAQAIQPIDPSIIQSALAQGGPLSTAEDLSGSSIWAMTPEMFKSTMQSRPDAMKQVSDATTLSDAVFNRSGQRKSMERQAEVMFDQRGKNLGTAANLFNSSADRQNQQQIHAEDRKSRERMAAADNKLGWARLGLETRKMEQEQMALKANSFTPVSATHNPELAKPYLETKKMLMDQKGKIANKQAYTEADLRYRGYAGEVRNGYTHAEDFIDSKGNKYPQLSFWDGRDGNPAGWYGKAGDGKVYNVLPMTAPFVKFFAGNSVSVPPTVNKYKPR